MADLTTIPVCLIEGIIYSRDPGPDTTGGGVTVSYEGGEALLRDLLAPYVGQAVEFHAHHHPPDPPDPNLPGGGSCLWGGHCPVGHQTRPGWLHRQHLIGTLAGNNRTLFVGGHPVEIQPLLGHRCRILVVVPEALTLPEVTSDPTDVAGLVNELSGLSELLKDLRKAVKV